MVQIDRERLLADMRSEDHATVVEAAKGLVPFGDFGSPAGAHLLAGAKAALHLGRLADAVVLTYHGLKVAEPNTLLWGDMLANRAIACAHHGFYPEAVDAGVKFLAVLDTLPASAKALVPYVHHALGLTYDRLRQFNDAAQNHRLAFQMHTDPVQRANAGCDLAYSLALGGHPDDADRVLAQVEDVENPFTQFVIHGTRAIVRFHQERYTEAVAAAAKAEALAVGNEDAWAVSLAEIRYWCSRALWPLGNRFRSSTLALYAAVVADQHWHFALRDAANAWLDQIVEMGGIQGA